MHIDKAARSLECTSYACQGACIMHIYKAARSVECTYHMHVGGPASCTEIRQQGLLSAHIICMQRGLHQLS